VTPVVGAAVVTGSAAVGVMSLIYVRRKRLKKLGKLRQESSQRPVDTAHVLVQRVETPEMTVHIGWMAGRRYASAFRDEFVEGVAQRAVEWTRGEDPTPSRMQRFARELESFRPDIQAYRDFERHRVARDLIDTVEDRRIVPKSWLIEAVVEDGLDDRGPAENLGHDPGDVHDMFEELTPEVLVEEPMTMEDSDGQNREVTGVRLRGDPMRPGDAQNKARFNGVFNAYTEGGESSKYGSPDVDVERELTVPVAARDVDDIDMQLTKNED